MLEDNCQLDNKYLHLGDIRDKMTTR